MKNWRTTLAGLFGGLIPILQTILANIQTGTPLDWSKIGLGVAVIVVGYFAKDFSNSGTIKQ